MSEKTPRKVPLPGARRRELGDAAEQWVRFEEAPGGLPLVARPAFGGLHLAAWAEACRATLDARLHERGAILFRGFDVRTPESLERFIRAAAGEPLAYDERSSPRSQVSGHVYTSTDHPPDQRIFLHNEQSYNLVFPLRLFFCCVTPADRGGETPIADARRIFQRIPPSIRRRFLEQGYLYVRNFGERLGLTWQTAFQTTEGAVVEAYCRANAIDFEWRPGGRLRTRQTRRAAGAHPSTGEPVWFNHATFFHVSTLPVEIGATLLSELGEEDLPNNTYYGDGSPIEPTVLDALRAAYVAEAVELPWESGDVLLLDNMLVSHGRATFSGPRRVLAGMAMPFRWHAVAAVEELLATQPSARRSTR